VANIHFSTLKVLPDYLPAAEYQAAMVAQFANVNIVEANERVVLLSPFTPSDSSNRWSSPQLDAAVQDMW
jgi:5-methylthioribose kinase